MTHLEFSWTWLTTSPLHCGSGLSRPGVADDLVQRDASGKPVIPGDAVKGLLRMSAHQVLDWLGAPEVYDDEDTDDVDIRRTSEPSDGSLLAHVFGGEAYAHFRPAVCDGMARVTTVSATAVDRETGRAAGASLRSVEVVSPGARFGSGCDLWVDDGVAGPVATLLLASLAAAESVGARRGVGAGMLDVESVSIEGRVGGKPLVIADAIAPEAVAELQDALARHHAAPAGTPAPRRSANREAPLAWHRIAIELVEPTTVGAQPQISNKVATRDSIPATTLRGAIRAALARGGVPPEQAADWLDERTRWTPAVPARVREDGVWELAAPVPASYRRDRDRSDEVVYDVLLDEPTDSDVRLGPYSEQWMWPRIDGDGFVLGSVRDLHPRELRMHVARDYRSGSKRGGALYAREALSAWEAAPLRFVAFARIPGGLAQADIESMTIGKRTSAGNGRVRVTVDELEASESPWPGDWSSDGSGTTVFAQALTPLALRDPSSGMPLRGLGAQDWEALAASYGFTGRIADVRIEQGNERTPAWMAAWRHGRAARTAIAAGSVWALKCATADEAAALRDAMRLLAAEGLGERRHEGYGWILVDPRWIGRASLSRTETARPDLPEPALWPGSEEADRSWLVAAARGALDISLKAEFSTPLQRLAALARSSAPREVLAFLDGMADRKTSSGDTRESAWKRLRKSPAYRHLESNVDDPGLFRFAIESLLVSCRKEVTR